MPVHNGRYLPTLGPLIQIGVKPIEPYDPESGIQSLEGAIIRRALIDTGADCTCISAAFALEVGLQPISIREMSSANGIAPRNLYLATVLIELDDTVVARTLEIMEFTPRVDTEFHALLGRDIQSLGALTLSSDGHFSFAL